MEILNHHALTQVAAGEFVPGTPSPEMICLNVKLMITAGRNKAGFDISAATNALMQACVPDFWDPNMAREWVITGTAQY